MEKDYEEMMEEFDDMDADIEAKKALIEEAKQIDESQDWNAVSRTINDLKRRWKKIHYSDSVYEDQLRDEFEGIIDKFYAKRDELYDENKKLKEQLIEKAKEVSESDQWKEATETAKDLMEEWKKIGTAGRQTDDELWDRFNEARQKFYDRKHDHWKAMNDRFSEVKDIKKDLIEKAKALQDSDQWKATSDKYRDLMDEWKSAGSAGREYEDALWQSFCEARQVFYDRRNEHFEQLHARQEENYEKKKQLVQQAELIAGTASYTRENTETMKNLSVQWKEIGSCGRDKENEIWTSFRTKMDDYFDGLRAFNDQKHEDWLERMKDTIAHKNEQIANQKRQIQRLNDDMNGLVSESDLGDMEQEIQQKEKFISQLEKEIEDIESKINEG